MSKADQLGAGRFGGGVRPISARRQAVAAATGVPTDAIAAPTELSLHRISPNPDNPRSKLGDLTELAGSLKTHGQKQAITVMNRDAYVRANPEREADLEPETTHVVVDGSSRLAAAREAGLDSLKVMVSDDQGTTSEELLESALVANIHRQALEELDEARALERLLAIYGSQRALATRLHRSQGWVSQRLALLNLTPELQARIGKEPIDLLRAVGNKPADQQEAALDELKEERLRKEEVKQARASKRDEAPAEREPDSKPADYAVITEDSSAHQASSVSVGDYGVITNDERAGEGAERTSTGETPSTSRAETVPEPRSNSKPAASDAGDTDERTPRKLPYDDGLFIAMHLIRKMDPAEFDKMLAALNEHQQSQQAAESPTSS
ncbi:ParB/RepB/Spo0J family partition protein (plasmid) [Streptomyces sp. NBC_01281]|uniref:ParB/RepB/Spo0J family partition protein n=1 Tax=Streptomyces sp. NBC_01281 TaxID=2903811 RepID=UPI002E14AB5E|nr:ParB/RepB/Spo0J family partition protein [Streptomyces sp. NBC_01281]